MHSSYSSQGPRRHSRKRISLSRLSSDTTATLPEYSSQPAWLRSQQQQQQSSTADDLPSDRPPDYPESADEADAETDESVSELPIPINISPHPHSPRRSPHRYPSQVRRRQPVASASDPYLDSLLERSVHALEMSNTLLQSSMSTQSSLAFLNSDQGIDRSLDNRARLLSSRMRSERNYHESWMDDLDEITKGVEGLFPPEAGPSSISQSLPTHNDSILRRHAPHRSSSSSNNSGLRTASHSHSHSQVDLSDTGHLRLSQWDRDRLVSPPPRALTQYIESTDADAFLHLPSTLGLRASSSHFADLSSSASSQPPPSAPARTVNHTLSHSHSTSLSSASSSRSFTHPINPLASASTPVLVDKPAEPSTPAYSLLSSVLSRKSSNGSSQTQYPNRGRTRASPSRSSSTRRGSNSSTITSTTTTAEPHLSPDRLTRRLQSHSRSPPPLLRISTPPLSPSQPSKRAMTPPIEELSASSSGSISSSTDPNLALQALRKILDDQPPPPPPPQQPKKQFMPKTPAPGPAIGSSNATASISRLFTKGTHTTSTRARSPPRQSALKGANSASASASKSGTPGEPRTPLSPVTPTGASGSGRGSGSNNGSGGLGGLGGMLGTLTLGGLVGHRNGNGQRHSGPGTESSAASSGRSTPKRISFAELPQSYAGGGSGRGFDRKAKGKGKRKKRGAGGGPDAKGGGAGEEEDEGAWWLSWLVGGMGGASSGGGGGGVGAGASRGGLAEERSEARMARNWGGSARFGGGMEDWAV